MSTQTRIYLRNSDEIDVFARINRLNLGKLRDAQQIVMTIDTGDTMGFILDPKNPLFDGERTVTKTAGEVRSGDRIFFRFAEALGSGKIRISDIGLTVIRGEFQFVKTEREVRFYSEGGEHACPELSDEDLIFAIRDLVRTDQIPDAINYVEPAVNYHKNEVIHFDPFLLYGTIWSGTEPLFFHVNDVVNYGYWRFLKTGTKVRYYIVPSGRTTFQNEATAVVIKSK